MTNAALPGDHHFATRLATGAGSPPPMPSIAASVLMESRLLAARTRRALSRWLLRG